jgi:hypothetical protein
VLEGRRGSQSLDSLFLLVLGGGSVLLMAFVPSRVDNGLLFPPYSGPWVIATLTILVSLMVAAALSCLRVEWVNQCGTAGASEPTASHSFLRRVSMPSPQESISLPTMQPSTCICVNHQPPQHMNGEKGLAKAPAITVLLPVLYGSQPLGAAVADRDKPFSCKRVFVRLFHGPP